MVHCDDGYKLKGDPKVYCKGGVWTNENRKPASAFCKDIGVFQFISISIVGSKLSVSPTFQCPLFPLFFLVSLLRPSIEKEILSIAA